MGWFSLWNCQRVTKGLNIKIHLPSETATMPLEWIFLFALLIIVQKRFVPGAIRFEPYWHNQENGIRGVYAIPDTQDDPWTDHDRPGRFFFAAVSEILLVASKQNRFRKDLMIYDICIYIYIYDDSDLLDFVNGNFRVCWFSGCTSMKSIEVYQRMIFGCRMCTIFCQKALLAWTFGVHWDPFCHQTFAGISKIRSGSRYCM